MACELFASSVPRTIALLVSPASRAVSIETLRGRRWESWCIIGHSSVARPRRVSTEFKGEVGIELLDDGYANGNGVGVGCEVVLGEVPRDSAAITS